MAVDNNLQVAAKLTVTDVCDVVTQAGENKLCSDEEAEEDQLAVHIPTNGEMRETLCVLQLGVQNRSSEFELYCQYEAFINDLLRKNMKQTKLDDFLWKGSTALHL